MIIKMFEKNGLWIYVVTNGKNNRGQDDFSLKIEGRFDSNSFEDIVEFLQRLKNRLYENQDQGFPLGYRLDEVF